jgi:HSP20 family protein
MIKVSAPRDALVSAPEFTFGFNPVRAVLGLLRSDRAAAIARAWPFNFRSTFSPTFDIKERHDVYVVRADLPGVRLQDVEVMLSHKRIMISGKREEETNGEPSDTIHKSERPYGTFSRTLALPPEVDVTQCQADLRDGVLTLELAKTSEAVMRKISVKSERARPNART